MKSQLKALVVGSLTALVGILSPATALANGVCYAVTEFVNGESPLIVRYLTTNVGSINSNAEVKEHYHLKQQAYSLVGKGTALFEETENGQRQFRIMTTLDGTIITGKETPGYSSPDEPGAHMGLDVQFVRFAPFDETVIAIGPITLECTSEQAKTAPDFWVCNVKAELQEAGFIFPVFALTLPIVLEKVNPLNVPACSVFQDGGGALPIIRDM